MTVAAAVPAATGAAGRAAAGTATKTGATSATGAAGKTATKADPVPAKTKAAGTPKSRPAAGREKPPPSRTDRAKAGYRKAKQGYGKASAALPAPTFARGSHPRQLLVAEFITSALIIALAPMSDKHADAKASDWLRRMSALCLLYLLLGLVAAAGPKPGRFAAAMGGLVTLSLLVSERDVLVQIAARLSPSAGSTPSGGGPSPAVPDETPPAPARGRVVAF